MMEAQWSALELFQPAPYSGSVALFRPDDRSGWLKRLLDARSQRWNSLARVMAAQFVGYQEITLMFDNPTINVLAEQLETYLAPVLD